MNSLPKILCEVCKKCRGFDVSESGDIFARCEIHKGDILEGIILKAQCEYFERESFVCYQSAFFDDAELPTLPRSIVAEAVRETPLLFLPRDDGMVDVIAPYREARE